ncbi:MAG: hypothetical protein ACTSRG_00235 [Candidatus Helarchaeota archaeon]
MKSIEEINIKFKCYDFPKDQQIKIIAAKPGWRIGKIKGLVRKKFRINPSFTIELTLRGEILSNNQLIEGLVFNPERETIKVIVSNLDKI